jgi:hypothetical protein
MRDDFIGAFEVLNSNLGGQRASLYAHAYVHELGDGGT